MPWSVKQHRLFEAAAHNLEVARRTGIKQTDATRMAHEGIKHEDKHRRRKNMMARALRGKN